MPQPDFEALRERMVRDQLAARDITDPRVLEAMRRVPRHRFVPPHLRAHAYEDNPLPIGCNQTISQPYVVALMTQLLDVRSHETILEIGTGSGYQTAVLCELAQMVYSLERHQSLADEARRRLSDLGYYNVEVFVGDGSQGFPDMAPFNGILAAAAAPAIPGPLQTQLADGGRLVIPIGDAKQQTLQRVRRTGDTWQIEQSIPVMFVPLFGRYGFKDDDNE
ncbi:MAG TPA: protein-L-isoaspartate(D-aspartate) O-methyltransferase [Aggregatilinea sp.]|uniref:protein-L-isoaspartate(D-aspartate) O-methyltransferase n=1 Tax=Aggregatilinea sp. TaxID=2806333 RepID=UPI002C2A2DA3|nr:protein-L-isoaspartate(D-aspartate) O-methyltransferase [Aggregatilinea sp.]HML21295.1 protein-L-isoaspartate(D-aspartate) O-methyltransferase [Aggregatilinea sp.]